MSEQGKRTPGTWVAQQDLSGGESSETALWSVVDPDGQIVFFGMDRDRANLIAAAPTMYEYIQSSASAGCVTAKQILEQINGHA